MTTILVTGGAGFIGSHTTLVLVEAGFQVVVVDNFSNSSKNAVPRIKELAGPRADSISFLEVRTQMIEYE